ncbi:integrase arm-type DNA-binding domain-containing protein [Tateyamaria omphalii]|uniref:tyrosine-type recombinase/integrase n=1 Tax=Tateyamaria omphalii TaxID=299262 RepID=UPI001C99C224|nr:site-specific integrase [Tateyamaria omphalii]MBY5934093.1 integrase arm-type DNA-binding domain-containing protein [Tateyamaria omphalii]
MSKLTHTKLKALPEGKHADGNGLYFRRRSNAQDTWLLRYTDPESGRRAECVIGTASHFTLASARVEAARMKKLIADGVSPQSRRAAQKAARQNGVPTLSQIAPEAFEARKAQLHNGGTAGRWYSPVRDHVLPRLGHLRVDQIHQSDVRDALKPIWTDMPDTARKAIGRLKIILEHAAAEGHDVNLNAVPLAKVLLGRQNKRPSSHASLPWQEVPMLYQSYDDGVVDTAFKFLVSTVVRVSNVTQAMWHEVDGDTWVIPATKMKVKNRGDHIVPLSPEARALLDRAKDFDNGSGYIFPSPANKKRPYLSENTFGASLKRRGTNVTAHGFRASFRGWVVSNDVCSERIAETILHHKVGDSATNAYIRGSFVEKRRAVMNRWSSFLDGHTAVDVIPFAGRA